jgi:hypothetical protein
MMEKWEDKLEISDRRSETTLPQAVWKQTSTSAAGKLIYPENDRWQVLKILSYYKEL